MPNRMAALTMFAIAARRRNRRTACQCSRSTPPIQLRLNGASIRSRVPNRQVRATSGQAKYDHI